MAAMTGVYHGGRPELLAQGGTPGILGEHPQQAGVRGLDRAHERGG
jgi:hypothetical protein